jgi:putative redox protein
MKFHVGENGEVQGDFEYGKLDISSNPEIGFRPVQLLISSLAGCSGGVLKKVLEKKRISFDSIEIESDIERNEEEANRVTKIALHYIVSGKNLDLYKVQKSLELAVKNCAMVQSVKDAIKIVETIEVRNI